MATPITPNRKCHNRRWQVWTLTTDDDDKRQIAAFNSFRIHFAFLSRILNRVFILQSHSNYRNFVSVRIIVKLNSIGKIAHIFVIIGGRRFRQYGRCPHCVSEIALSDELSINKPFTVVVCAQASCAFQLVSTIFTRTHFIVHVFSFNSTASTWCSPTMLVHLTTHIVVIRCQCCPEMSDKTWKKVEKVSYSTEVIANANQSMFTLIFSIHCSYYAAVGPRSIDTIERRISDVVQVDQWQESADHARWCTWVCCWWRQNLYSILGTIET